MTNRSPEPTGSPSSITVSAPAKINLVLRILDRRPDGYHNLWSLMQTVSLEDELSISINHGHTTITLRCDEPSLKTDPSNLVYRAAAEVLEQSGRPVGLDVTLTKRIPMGAGLGGGSSDAASVLMGNGDGTFHESDRAVVAGSAGLDVCHALVEVARWPHDEWAEWTRAPIAHQLFGIEIDAR